MNNEITVQGMTCGHCAQAVTTELLKIESVHDVSVDVATGLVSFESDQEVSAADIAAAVDEAGYSVV